MMNPNNPTVSIIIPVYNAELYLSQCIGSILNQSFADWEIIIANDGSTDNSGEIGAGYAAQDSRIHLFYQPNQGVSKARNLALNHAQGEYIMFMDADDYWCADTCLETLVAMALRFNADLVRGEYKRVSDKGVAGSCKMNARKKRRIAQPLTPVLFLKNIIQGEFFLWLSLIRRSALQNIRFRENQVFLEDMDFYCQILSKPLVCVYIPLCFYAYRQHSTNASAKRTIKNLEDSLGLCERFQEYAELTKDLALKKAFLNYQTLMYYWTLGSIADRYFPDRRSIAKHLKLEENRKRVWSNLKKHSIINHTLPYILLPAMFSIPILKGRNWLIWHILFWARKSVKYLIDKLNLD